MPGPIVILAIGSRGDVQPRVILGRDLQSRGYPVRSSPVTVMPELSTMQD